MAVKHTKITPDDPTLLPSDSDDDDYAPDAVQGAQSDSESDSDDELLDDDGRPIKRRKKQQQQLDQKEPQLTKEAVDDLWASFNAEPSPYGTTSASSSTATTSKPATKPKKMLTITVKYEFAGQVVEQEKQVEQDSDEAKKWLATQLPKKSYLKRTLDETTLSSSLTQQATSTSSSAPTTKPSSSSSAPAIASTSVVTSESAAPPSKPTLAPPRRPKAAGGGLNALAAQLKKPPKLNTLEKSKLDWNKFVSKEEGLADTLSQSRKNGYLDKQDFLDKAQQAKDEAWEQSKSTRRR
ncbi:hypothetical protein ACM66B_006024 [Microbotryomycetes sp. NB124-2]